MSTCLYDFVDKLQNKWNEVDVLINKAKHIRSTDEPLYNALCRSIVVLIVAHFEGFAKELIKCVIVDLNDRCSFAEMPEAIKRTYCMKYLGNIHGIVDKHYETKMQRLIEKFDSIDCKITFEPFLFPVNKNPNTHVLSNIFKHLGLKKVFEYFHESELDNAFSDTNSQLEQRIDNLKNSVSLAIQEFPYNFDVSSLKLTRKTYRGRTFWEDFVDDINLKRHDVAHGNNFDNIEDIDDLVKNKNKIILLELGLVGLMSYVSQRVKPKEKQS